MRNEQLGLAALLLISAGAARAEPGAWFPASPCNPDNPVVIALLGGHALLAVHAEPEVPPHDVLLHRGMDGTWRVPLEEWSRWTPLPPPAVENAAGGAAEVPLKPHAGFAYRIDFCTTELWVDANPARMQELKMAERRPGTSLATAGWGGFLNLDAEYGGFAGSGQASGLVDLGAFAPAGAGRSGFFAGQRGTRRLDSDLIHDDPGDAVRLRLGDSISHSAEWESSVRFGGVQWGRDFSLQPDRITFPLPTVSGSAALASTAQLYVNGERLSQQPLQPGQFRLDSVPVLTGAGDLSVVIRDALGREQTVVQPFYASPRLLDKGLSAYTLEGGFLREDYAQPGDRYTHPFAAAIGQLGLTAKLTGLVRAVGGDRRQQLGAELDWIVGNFGLVTLSGAPSHTEAGWGGVTTLAFERVANPLSLSLRRRIGTRAYGDLGRDPGMLHFSDIARLSFNANRAGVASLLYVSEQPWDGSGTRLVGLAYSMQILEGLQSYASWLHPLVGPGGDSFVVGLTASLGRGTSGGVQGTRDSNRNGARAFLQHSPSGPLGWSYYGTADANSRGVRQAQVAWATERGTVGAGYASIDGRGSPDASLQTGFALLDGHAYWTRPVQNSFAVVDAGNVPGVRVYRENQQVGATDAHGRLLVPDLLPFQTNHLGIDDRDLPIGLGLLSGAGTIAPPANAGVPVHFAVDTQPSTRLHLVNAAGAAVPVGAVVYVDGVLQPLPVGYDGLVYADLGEGPHMLEARWSGGACQTRLSVAFAGAAQAAPCRAVP